MCNIHTGVQRLNLEKKREKNVNCLITNFHIDCMLKLKYFGSIGLNEIHFLE